MDATEDLVTSAEAAVLLGVDRSGIVRRVKTGALKPSITLPGRTGSHLFDRAAVLALVDGSPEPAPASPPPGERGGFPASPAGTVPEPGASRVTSPSA